MKAEAAKLLFDSYKTAINTSTPQKVADAIEQAFLTGMHVGAQPDSEKIAADVMALFEAEVLF